jgi:hypothetical protein
MDTKSAFQVAGGSVPGRRHRMAGRNNQDAFAWAASDGGLVAVVSDGCGSGPHSEVGAQIGARLVVRGALRLARAGLGGADLLERLRGHVLHDLRRMAAAMRGPEAGGAHLSRVVADYFLFTLVGLLVAGDTAITFSLGDGLIVVDGAPTRLGPFADNQPPYLGYGLLPGSDGPRFQLHHQVPAQRLGSALLATDGVAEAMLDDAPGSDLLGPFWTDDRIFRNADMIRRRLTVVDRQQRLADDSTLVVVRRRGGR